VNTRILVAGLVIALGSVAGAIATVNHDAASPPIYGVSSVLVALRTTPRAWAGRTIRVRGTVWFDQYLHGPLAPPQGWALPHGIGIVLVFRWGGQPVPQPPPVTWLNRDYIAHAAITPGIVGGPPQRLRSGPCSPRPRRSAQPDPAVDLLGGVGQAIDSGCARVRAKRGLRCATGGQPNVGRYATACAVDQARHAQGAEASVTHRCGLLLLVG